MKLHRNSKRKISLHNAYEGGGAPSIFLATIHQTLQEVGPRRARLRLIGHMEN